MMTDNFVSIVSPAASLLRLGQSKVTAAFLLPSDEAAQVIDEWSLRLEDELQEQAAAALQAIDNTLKYYDCASIREARSLASTVVDLQRSLRAEIERLDAFLADKERPQTRAEVLPRTVECRDGLIDWLRSSDKPLYHLDSYSQRPRKAYVELDLGGNVDAYYRTRHDIAEPVDVVHRVDLWFTVSPCVHGPSLADLLEGAGMELLDRVHRGRTVSWHNSERMGVFTSDAERAIQRFIEELAQLSEF